MGLFEKTGCSTADDVVNYCENQLTLFALSYCEAVSIVTDTEPTMIAAGQIIVQRSLKGGVKTKWLGFIDHLLQLVIKMYSPIYPCQKGHSRHVEIWSIF